MIDNENVWIRIIGRIKNDLKPYFMEALELDGLTEKQIVVFCTHSAFDIPVGYSFTHIKDHTGKEGYRGEIVLKNVTQQFYFPLSEIPHGWKTICKFEFGEAIPKIVKELPKLDGWYKVDKYLIFE
jgi:hypothetical protein